MNLSGLLHSEIHGSKLICSSPWLIAAYHVFLRLLVPRHSPCALCSLTNYACSHDLIVVFVTLAFCNCNLYSHSQFHISLFNFQGTIHFSKPEGLVVGSSGLEPPTSRLSGVRSNHLSYEPMFLEIRLSVTFPQRNVGGDEEDRTPDPLRARQVLSQLSYTPIYISQRTETCSVSLPFSKSD